MKLVEYSDEASDTSMNTSVKVLMHFHDLSVSVSEQHEGWF